MDALDLAKFRFWNDLFWICWSLLVSGFLLFDRRNKVTQEAIATMRAELVTLKTESSAELAHLKADLDLRRRRVDENLEGMKLRLVDLPTRDDVGRLQSLIGEVAQLANELRGTVHSLQNTMQLINQHLLEQKHG